MQQTDQVLFELWPPDPRIAVTRLNRPAQRNAVDTSLAVALRAAVDRFEADPALRVALLTGVGPVFCAGMDLAAFAAGERPGFGSDEGFAWFVHRARRKPIIAAVQGSALAGGFELMLACDLAVAAGSALFGLPEVRRGLIAAGGGSVRLPARLPPAIAREMLLTGAPIGAERALALGLVNAVVAAEEVEAAAGALASTIADNAPAALAATKRVCDAVTAAAEAAGWIAAAQAWAEIERSHDACEGALAFKEKRSPVWRGGLGTPTHPIQED